MSKKEQWLQVNNPYSGIDTNGLVVQAGTYPVGAPELYGASDSLVAHGSAEWVNAPEKVEVVETVEAEAVEEVTPDEVAELDKEIGDGSVELSSLTNNELRAMLEEKGIDHSSAKNKTDLLALFGEAK